MAVSRVATHPPTQNASPPGLPYPPGASAAKGVGQIAVAALYERRKRRPLTLRSQTAATRTRLARYPAKIPLAGFGGLATQSPDAPRHHTGRRPRPAPRRAHPGAPQVSSAGRAPDPDLAPASRPASRRRRAGGGGDGLPGGGGGCPSGRARQLSRERPPRLDQQPLFSLARPRARPPGVGR